MKYFGGRQHPTPVIHTVNEGNDSERFRRFPKCFCIEFMMMSSWMASLIRFNMGIVMFKLSVGVAYTHQHRTYPGP